MIYVLINRNCLLLSHGLNPYRLSGISCYNYFHSNFILLQYWSLRKKTDVNLVENLFIWLSWHSVLENKTAKLFLDWKYSMHFFLVFMIVKFSEWTTYVAGTKSDQLCCQYTRDNHTQSDQASRSANFKFSSWYIYKKNSKNGSWTSPFNKFSRLKVKIGDSKLVCIVI